MFDLNNNRHAVIVWCILTFALSGVSYALVGLTGHFAPANAAETWTYEACAFYDAWGEAQCEQADTEGRPTDVLTYEDGSQVAHRAWAGFTQSNGQWVACLPAALCND